jgi:hypothetical protein
MINYHKDMKPKDVFQKYGEELDKLRVKFLKMKAQKELKLK